MNSCNGLSCGGLKPEARSLKLEIFPHDGIFERNLKSTWSVRHGFLPCRGRWGWRAEYIPKTNIINIIAINSSILHLNP